MVGVLYPERLGPGARPGAQRKGLLAMKQARKSRYQLFGWAALAALLLVAAIGTAVANADGAGDEYTLNLPGGSNASGGGAAGGGGESSGPSASVSGAKATSDADATSGATATDTTGSSGTATETGGATASGGSGTTAAGEGKSGDGSNGSGSGANPNGGLVGSDQAQPGTNLGAGSSSDGGGVPAFLIAIAVLAAICVGVAIWRMRRKGPDEHEPGATTEIDPGTQSL